ncbi:MAG: hypothetical protein GEU73_05935 [Chloroflexi bacterium]|nr:hypothetical protein [Chloroflexota bacterium]
MSDPVRTDGGYRPSMTLQDTLAGIRRVVVTAHVDPDADGLGSVLGLAHTLRREGWITVPVCIGTLASFASSLPGAEHIIQFPSHIPPGENPERILQPGDGLVVMDTPTPERLSAFFDAHRETIETGPLIVFDHHITNEGYGTANFIDPGAAATAEVVCDVIEASGMAIDSVAATCFMVALLADTQVFRTENTSPRSLLWGHRLALAGAPIFPIAEMLFKSRRLPGLQLWGAALSRVRSEGGVVWTWVTQEMLRDAGATMEDAEGLVDFLLGSQQTRVAVVLKEHGPKETKVSMRTAPGVDATRIVGAFGGGGHIRAAGCTIQMAPDEAAHHLIPVVFDELRAVAASN